MAAHLQAGPRGPAASSSRPRVGDALGSGSALAALGVAAVVLLIAYAPVLSFWWHKWFEPDSYYSHAPFVPVASAILVVMARHKIAALPLRPSAVGFLIMVFAALVGLVGRMSATVSLMGLMLPIYIFGAVVAVFGWPTARAVRFSVFFLFFMCVLPESAVAALSFRAQMESTALAGLFLNAAGMDAVAHGARLTLPSASVQIGEACSGFRLLISLFAIGVFLAHIREIPKWRRYALAALALPLGLIVNALRIGAIAAVGEFEGRSAMIAAHDWTGWMVLFIAAALLLRLSRPEKCVSSSEISSG